jgi:hypothetical protein
MPDLTQVTAPSGAKFTVAKDAADAFSGFLTDLEKTGYKIDQKSSGGYNPRNIAGTNTPSQHAFGHAIDINPGSNPRGAKGPSDLPANVADLAAAHGLTWGGGWSGDTRDPMHFELSGKPVAAAPSVDDLAARIEALRAKVTPGAPAAPSEEEAPSVDDLAKRIEALPRPPAPPAASAPTTDPAIPTPRPAIGKPADNAGDATSRILGAFKDAYMGAPDLLAPGPQATVDSWGSVPATISRLPGTALGVASGLYRGAQQAGIESGLAPDVASLPDAFAGSPHMLVPPETGLPATMPRGPYTPPGPNLLAGGVEPVQPGLAARAGEQAVNSWLQQGALPESSAVPQRPPGAPMTAPTTAAEAKAIANAHYGTASQTDSGLTPQFNKKLTDAISPARETESLVGKNDAADLVDKLKARADKPLSIRGVQEQDEDMTQLIEQHRDPVTGKLDKVGQQIDEMQDKFREQIDNAGPGDTTGGPVGFDALQNGRAAWAQYRKMADVERMWDRARNGRQVPQTSFQAQVGNYLTSKKAAGWTAEEKASLTDAAKNGLPGAALHLLGNKLIATIHGAIGAKWGLPGFVVSEVASQGLATGARALENRWLAGRIGDTQRTLGSSVPPSPLLPTLPPVGASGSPPPSTVPYWAAPLLPHTQQRNWLNPSP